MGMMRESGVEARAERWRNVGLEKAHEPKEKQRTGRMNMKYEVWSTKKRRRIGGEREFAISLGRRRRYIRLGGALNQASLGLTNPLFYSFLPFLLFLGTAFLRHLILKY